MSKICENEYSDIYKSLENKLFELTKLMKEESKENRDICGKFATIYTQIIESSPDLSHHELDRLLVLAQLMEGYLDRSAMSKNYKTLVGSR